MVGMQLTLLVVGGWRVVAVVGGERRGSDFGALSLRRMEDLHFCFVGLCGKMSDVV